MKYIFGVIVCLFIFSIMGICQCPKNSDDLYDREKTIKKFVDILGVPMPTQSRGGVDNFFVYDLTEPSNKFTSVQFSKTENCIDFLDKHIYHFSVVEFELSLSNIAILENGNIRVFKSVNCVNGENTLSKVIEYVERNPELLGNKKEVLTRLKNYRRYGNYVTTDGYRVICNFNKEIPENSDKLYDRWKVLNRLSGVLLSSVSEKVQEQLSWRFFTEESRANGFFVYDLTEPSNKQTSLLERVEFKNNHVYHFAFIDLPFSFSNIAVLEDGKLKIFKAINCEGKGSSLQDVVGYLNEKLKNDKNKDEIIKRVKNYREYGVYVPFNGISTPQCEEVLPADK